MLYYKSFFFSLTECFTKHWLKRYSKNDLPFDYMDRSSFISKGFLKEPSQVNQICKDGNSGVMIFLTREFYSKSFAEWMDDKVLAARVLQRVLTISLMTELY
jgi:hypothetical protein